MEVLAGNIEAYLKTSMFMSFIASFAGGVVTSFTPCVYPMIPITAGYICASNVGGSKVRSFGLALSYVTGVALVYASLGMFAAISGRLFGEVGTNPYAYLTAANVMIIAGLGMLDVFSIPILTPKGVNGCNGGYAGAFLIGSASGFVAAPCTAPVLGVLLAYAATRQNVLLGGGLLFVFSIGLGILLVIVGTFSGILAALPRSGVWMVKIKKGMGIFMIALGEYFLIKMGRLL